MGRPLVSINIVTHDNRQDIQACLEAVLRSRDVALEVIVADNASTDGTPELVRQAFPAVRLVEYTANLGFAEANNRAVRLAQGDFVLLLNADAVVAPDAIAVLASRMASDPQIGVLAPKMLFLQEPRVINSVGLQANRICYSCDRGFLEYNQGQYDAEADVIGACGGAMFLRRAVSEHIGLFDSRYFMYYEDLDFCLRTWVAGYRVLTVPQAVVYHRMRAYGRSECLNEYVDHRNRLRTMLKNLSLASLRHVLPLSLAFDLVGIAGHLRKGRWSAARWRVQALLWNLVMLPDTLAWRAGVQRWRAAPDDVFLHLLDKGRGYPQINAPLPSFQPAFAAALEPIMLQPCIEPGRQEAEAQLGLGWHGVEDWAGLPVRWTSRYAIAFLPKTWEGPGYLTIRYFAPLSASGQVLINDRLLCRFSGTFNQWETLQAETDARPGVVKVTLLLDKTLNPWRDRGATDNRDLGVAVTMMSLGRTRGEVQQVVSAASCRQAGPRSTYSRPHFLLDRAAAAGGELAEARQSQELYQKLNWMESPLIAGPYINRQISGDPVDNWLIWVKKALVPQKLGCGLSLGCGEGCLERHATSLGICEAFDAFDISSQAITIAQAKAAQEGCAHIHYEVRDVNKIQLPPEHYDIAFASSALHHIAKPEHVLDEVHKALKPDCFFIANEFVGPSRFQWTDKQLQIINELLALLPPRYRADLRRPGQIKSRVERPTVAQMLLSDPSEAVRSAEIVPLIQQRFEIVQQIDFGGTILHMLLSDIVGNFAPDSEADVTIVRLLCYLEKTLIAEGVLPSDFTLIVARKQAAPVARGGAP